VPDSRSGSADTTKVKTGLYEVKLIALVKPRELQPKAGQKEASLHMFLVLSIITTRSRKRKTSACGP
jgi:hypothetical protein